MKNISVGNYLIESKNDIIVYIFFMNKTATISKSIEFTKNSYYWKSSIVALNHAIIIETNKLKISDKEQNQAYNIAQNMLDIIFFQESNNDLIIMRNHWLILESLDDKSELSIISTEKKQLRSNIVVKVENGIAKPRNSIGDLSYHESMRYYRASMHSNDLFESYRNLYLCLESIFHENNSTPIEGENWLKTSCNKIEPCITDKISDLLNGTSFFNYIKSNHYTKYRNKLSHSRHDIIPPFSLLIDDELYSAYIKLNKIIDVIYQEKYSISIPRKNSLIVTPHAVSLMAIDFKKLSIIFNDIMSNHQSVIKESIDYKSIDNSLSACYYIKKDPNIENEKFNQLQLRDLEEIVFTLNFNEYINIHCTDTIKITFKYTLANENPYDRLFN